MDMNIKTQLMSMCGKAGRCQCAQELPRVNKTNDPVEDQKSKLLSFSAISLKFCSILVKFYKTLRFIEFHSI